MSTNKNGMAAELKVMPLLGKIIELCVTSGTQLMCNICGIVVQINYCANSIVHSVANKLSQQKIVSFQNK